MEGVTVVLTDGRKFPIDVSNPRPSDLVAVERQFHISADDMDGPDRRTEWTLYVIWRMCSRQDEGIKSLAFDEFVDLVDDLVREDDEEANPTPSAPPIE